ncbi:MAG: hypothetical protein JSV13_05485 [Nitrospiraceae bacterium]|nr:MAG: hypothetical protein JSV13_05485 [Nitrospiraceae bacterium]
MLRLHLITISVILVALVAHQGTFAEDISEKVKGPIQVTSDTLTADKIARTMLFEHNVIARSQDMTLYADKMVVTYKKETGDVSVIEATGSVKLNKDTQLITAQTATYYADEDKVVFSGNPRALDGENVVTGTRMIYFISDDRTYVENSSVYLKE